MIEIERIEIVTPIHGRPGAVMAQRVETIDGRTRFIEPIDLLIGFDGTELPSEVQDALAAINTQQQNMILELQEQLTTLTTERDAAVSQATSANELITKLQSRIDELTALPPNPFSETDWQGFRSAALASPTILRMAMANTGNFVMLLIYMTEMQKDQSAISKMATVWNEMENKTPLSPEEIAGVNNLAEQFKVPLVFNSDGQIQL